MDYILQLLCHPPLHPDTLAGPAPTEDFADGGVDGADHDASTGGRAVGERESLLAFDKVGPAATEASSNASSAKAMRPASVQVQFCPDMPTRRGQAQVDLEAAGDSDERGEDCCCCFKFSRRRAAAAGSGNELGAGRLECGDMEGGDRPKLLRLGDRPMSKVKGQWRAGDKGDIGWCRGFWPLTPACSLDSTSIAVSTSSFLACLDISNCLIA
jgi:hypothetical protein